MPVTTAAKVQPRSSRAGRDGPGPLLKGPQSLPVVETQAHGQPQGKPVPDLRELNGHAAAHICARLPACHVPPLPRTETRRVQGAGRENTRNVGVGARNRHPGALARPSQPDELPTRLQTGFPDGRRLPGGVG